MPTSLHKDAVPSLPFQVVTTPNIVRSPAGSDFAFTGGFTSWATTVVGQQARNTQIPRIHGMRVWFIFFIVCIV